ncbi:hypothetical protein C7974DRAFT_428779 [Boeremia exigua]|uniref:uncharacterized protein n=1 Tax=Boeremia exigua TaxID=749465 RepID=UPI001E8CB7C1|nr:uncharacterized protein C7974DRAFT_428779 [Boeremia exigua]KAH6613051.1 hypothetical protein C7974DRAFT_428779 [Boeremia exigua]
MMRSLTIATLAGLSSVVSSQVIDLAYVNAQPDPTYTIVPDQRAQTVTYNQDSAIASVVAVALQTPVPDPGEGALHSRNVFGKRAGPCEDLQNNANTYNAKLDPAEAFLADETLQKQAKDAKLPAGYTQVYSNLQKAASANGYMGYTIMPSYNVQTCADKCSSTLGCQGFNTYFERSPSKAPAAGCQDPPGSANPFCVLWGGPVSKDNALNEGQWREKYHVVITASNGYVLTTSINPLSGKAINAPLDCNKNDAYMGMRLLTDNAPFDPQRCAAICEATTQYNIDHPEAGKAPRLCKFYNTYILNKNYISQGQACSMYTQYWDPNTYATNDGQWDGQGNHYTISSSTFFSNKTDIVTPVCPADVDKLKTNSDATSFCASYISYVAPTTSTVTVGGGATTVEACGQPTGRISKRDDSDPALIEAVVGVFPSKVDNTAVTGTEPALATIPAQDATDAEALASATSAAIAQLEATAGAATSATPAPSSTQGDAASTPSATDASKTQGTPAAATNAATSSAPARKRAASTPDVLAGRNPIEISSACSQIVGSSTPTVTVTAAASTTTTYRKCNNFPAKCADSSPARAFAGDFSSSPASIDDNVYTLVLPFQVCIYDTCSTKVNPTSNGIISLAEYRNIGYLNDKGLPNFGGKAVLAALWQDMYIYQDEAQYMSYTTCGDVGKRTVTFDWRISAFQDVPQSYRFSATFYEDKPGRILLRYFELSDKGTGATIGIEGSRKGKTTFSTYSQKKAVANGLAIVWDPVSFSWSTTA